MERLSLPLQNIFSILKRYVTIISIVIFGAMYGYLIYTAGQQAELQPSETRVNEAVKNTSRPRLDAGIAEKLKQLESQNIEVKALFDKARNNPFSE